MWHSNYVILWSALNINPIFDKIPSNHLDDTRPIKTNIEDLEKKEYLLSKAELDKMKSDFTILVTRVLVQFFPCLSYLKDDVCKH